MRSRFVRVVVVAFALPAQAQRPTAPAVPLTQPSTARSAAPLAAASTAPVDARAPAAPPGRPWMDPALPAGRRAQLLLAQMTLEEKFWQLYMTPGDPVRDSASFAHGAYGVQLLDLREDSRQRRGPFGAAEHADSVQRFFIERSRLGIPVIVFEEGVHGLMQLGATVFPQAIGLAATFDLTLMDRVAREIAREARERGVRQLLSPVINLARDPRWGRVEETYGEDAFLSGAMGVAYVRALERAGVVATPKHLVANYGDGGRDSYPITLDAATLADLYLAPFHDAMRAGGAHAVMASYNSVNGLPASANRDLLSRTLRGDWGFDGVVVADQGGVGGASVLHHTAANYADAAARALPAGLDVIFQGSVGDASLFWPAFRDGLIPSAVVDTAVARVLRLKFALGLFDYPYERFGVREPQRWSAELHWLARDLARVAAERSLVLLRNERSVLPLAASTKRIAVIGVGADAPLLGGYTVPRPYPTTLLWALQTRLAPADTVLHAPGPGLEDGEWKPVAAGALHHHAAGARVNGLVAEYFATPSFDGNPVTVRSDAVVDFTWTFMRPARGIGTDWYAVRWSGGVQVPAPGVRLAVEGDDGYRLWVDDTLVVDAWRKVSYGLRAGPAVLTPGSHALRLEYRQTTGTGRIRLLWNSQDSTVSASGNSRIADAVEVARRAEVAVVTVSVDEGEFRDRSSLRLPGRQEELIARVAATGTPTIVVIYAGGAVITAPWHDRVGAVLQAFYPGEAGAEAVSRVLFGDVNPAARLPYTVPRSEGQLPLVYDHLPTGRGDDYVDLTGQPLFPFGYGLSYTTFSYRDLALSQTRAGDGDTVHVRFSIRNDGQRAGDEVAQLYVRHVTAPTAQPVLALRGFARVTLRPGEERTVDLALSVRALATRDALGAKAIRDGDVILYVGASSRDIRLRGTLHTIGAPR